VTLAEPLLSASRGFQFGDLYPLVLLGVGVGAVTAIAALSRQHDRAFSPAIVYLVMGAGASSILQALGVPLLEPLEDARIIERAAEFAVIIALFSAGMRLDRPFSRAGWSSTMRLIIGVMPLTIAGVAAFAHGVMGLSLGVAILLGAILAPTDPVLAAEVQVGPPGERNEPEPQFALTSEAGLNDGLAFPFVFLGLFVAQQTSGWGGEWLLADVVYAIAVGLVLGAAGGWLLGLVTAALRRRGWLLAEYDSWLAVAAVLAIYGLTEVVGAYGFLAAFAGGLAFRRRERGHEYHERVHEGAEMVERLMELALILLLTGTVTIAGLGTPGLAGWLLVPALLLVIRPLAVFASFARSSLPIAERAFIGWFGIRGIGSFYYAAVALGAGVLTTTEAETIYWTVIACAGISIIVHGITASPASRRLESLRAPTSERGSNAFDQ
jgi:NhaP-type Na+/H+ or K+/H+ antiporter